MGNEYFSLSIVRQTGVSRGEYTSTVTGDGCDEAARSRDPSGMSNSTKVQTFVEVDTSSDGAGTEEAAP